jgi:hypothetical protein
MIFWDHKEIKTDRRSLALAQKYAETIGSVKCAICGGHAPEGRLTCWLTEFTGRSGHEDRSQG